MAQQRNGKSKQRTGRCRELNEIFELKNTLTKIRTIMELIAE